jgi:hypothetical protein
VPCVAVQELVESDGRVLVSNGVWLDPLRTHCFATFETVDMVRENDPFPAVILSQFCALLAGDRWPQGPVLRANRRGGRRRAVGD